MDEVLRLRPKKEGINYEIRRNKKSKSKTGKRA